MFTFKSRSYAWFGLIVLIFAVGALTSIAAQEENTVSTLIRIEAHKFDDGSVEFAWRQKHPNDVWTARRQVGRLPAGAETYRYGEPVWYVSNPITVTTVVSPQAGDKYGAVRRGYFVSQSKIVPLDRYEDGWYRISVTASPGGGRPCDQIRIMQAGRSVIDFPSAENGENVTYERIVKIGTTTVLTRADIEAAADPDLREHQDFRLSSNCGRSEWTIEQLDWPAYGRRG